VSAEVIAPRSLRRRIAATCIAVIGGALAASLCAAPAGAATRTDPVPPASTPPTPQIRVMQLNIAQGLSPQNWAADAQAAISVSDIAAFNEAGRAACRSAMADMLERNGWAYWLPAKTGLENPVTWNASKFEFVSGTSVEVTPAIRRLTPERAINTVVLRDLATGQLIAVVATHTINKGAPDGGLKQDRRRTPLLKKHILMLRTAILAAEKITPFVIGTGDWNVNHLRDRNIQAPGLPVNILGSLVNFDMPLSRTWRAGNSLLDYIVTPKLVNTLQLVGSSIFKKVRSDHYGVLAGFDYPEVLPQPVPGQASGTRFMPQVVRNNPHRRAARREVLRLIQKTVNNAGVGSAIHVATKRLQDPGVYHALVRAHQRGVRVQVVTQDRRLTSQERSLRALLGRQTDGGEWFATCTSKKCRSVSRQMSPTTVLVSRSGATSAVRVIANRGLDSSAARQRTSARLTTSLTTYNNSFWKFFQLVA